MESRTGNWIEIRWNGWFFLNVCKNNLTRIGLMNIVTIPNILLNV